MASFQEQINHIKKLRSDYQRTDQTTYADKLKIQKGYKATDESSAFKQLKTSEARLKNSRISLNEAIKKLHLLNIRSLTKELNGKVPVVMLPVRIETRFVNPPISSVPELWIRIFPDDIHTNTHEPAMTQGEIDAGQAYWTAMADVSSQLSPDEKEEARKNIWLKLKETVTGAQRAIWVAKSTKPVNWINMDATAPTLQFPTYPEIKTHSWTRAPQTQALPDRFVVTIFRNGKSVHEQIGNIIPDTVFLGPDPMAAEEAIKKEANDIRFNEDIDWLQHFDRAIELGLGMKIRLQPTMFATGNKLERLTVLGLAHSADADNGKMILETLFENHHCASKGFSFLKQGTPTNNTEKDGSGYVKNEDLLARGYYTGAKTGKTAGSDLDLFTRILGIDISHLDEVNNGDLSEHAQALMMNTALYAATLSYYFNELMDPVIKESDANLIRSFFTNYVSARGPLPAIRVGDQPYGVLLSSDLDRWTETNSKFYTGMALCLNRLQQIWDGMVAGKVPSVAKGGDTETLLKILGLHSGSVAFRQRLGNLPDFSYALGNININNLQNDVQALNHRIVTFLKSLGFVYGKDSFYPLISNMIFYDRTTPLSDKKLLLPNVAGAENEFLPALPKSGLNYIEWMAQKATVAALESVNFDGDKPPRTLLAIWLRHAMLTELRQAGTKFYIKNKLPINLASFEKSLYNFDKAAPDLTSYELLRGEPQKLDRVKFANVRGNLGDYLLGKFVGTENRQLSEMKKAMSGLAKLSTKTLEKNLRDFVDLCSYRLDAWQTGLFTRRALANRAAAPTGAYIGAYGWVENLKAATHIPLAAAAVPQQLKPSNGIAPIKLKENAGFTHVPSLNHATAMGLLLAGYKNHASRSKTQAFSINLSSERTRNALSLLQGVSNGQSIEALLGYQFERAVHDATTKGIANLNRYIYEFRNKYEIQNISVPQQGAAEAQETIDSYPVVNGLKIIKASVSEIGTLVANQGDRTEILKIRDKLADSLDACNDLLLAESAYQLTQGNQDRTSGVLNATLLADTPPEIQVTETPRSSLFTYTHRISVHFRTEGGLSLGVGWPSVLSPRARFEPGLNLWLSELIGDPQQIFCTAAALDANGNATNTIMITLSDLELHPIDLVYMIPEDLGGGATELESRIAYYFRKRENTDTATGVRISFSPEAVSKPGKTLAQVYPLLRSLKMLIGSVRAASAKDFISRKKVVNESTDDSGIDFNEWHERIHFQWKKLSELYQAFNETEPAPVAPKDEFNPETIADFFQTAAAQPNEKERYERIELSDETLNKMMQLQITASTYGVQLAYPENLTFITLQKKKELLEKTQQVWQVLGTKIAKTNAKLGAAAGETNIFNKIKLYTEASKILLGDDFVPLPQFQYANTDDLQKTFANESQLLAYHQKKNELSKGALKDAWIQSVARVRKDVARFETVRTMAESISQSDLRLQMAQVPFRPDDSWLGVEFPKEYAGAPFTIMDDTVSLALIGETAFETAQKQSAWIIDEWTEKIPIADEVTGVAFHYNQPNAAAPQSIIVAIEPTGGEKWDWDVLQGVLDDTLRRSKSRAVEPDHIMEHETLSVLLPMTIASFDVNEANVSLDYLLLSDKFQKLAATANLQLYKKWN
ncbi:hypothetical protein ABDK00_013940 [Niabella insulamsoli]|uniref:hypothetical protein n=1 Tax=Niabella insulamsoli TaxID=3144874 RepID=UPI0031FC940B